MKKILSNQKGFTLIELLVVMSVIGILATVAVPRFTNAINLANTAKIQSDLQVINSSIVMYQAQNGKYPDNIKTDLRDYITDIDNLKPPTGSCVLADGTTTEITATEYTLAADKTYALFQGKKVSDFGRKTKSSSQ